MNPIVTVVCLAYNHEKYIRKCLDGFIMQKTSFPFEVIVHDDASTDSTASIIKEYEENYPDIIKPIYQKENQYSQGKSVISFCVAQIRGKYVALCEGDDYWSVSNKLELQVNALNNNVSCKMSVHRVGIIMEDGTDTNESYPPMECHESVISSEEFVSFVCKEKYFQTSSYFFDAYWYKEFYNSMPEFKKIADVGDDPLKLFFATLGPVYYYDNIMSYYRQSSVSSWTKDNWNTEKHFNSMVRMMKSFDDYSNRRFHDSCDYRIRHFEFMIAGKNLDYKTMANRKYNEFRKNLPFKSKIAIRFYAWFPCVFKKKSQRI